MIMGSTLGIFFSKTDNVYYNIKFKSKNQYLASQLYSSHYRILDKSTFEDNFIQCSEKALLNLEPSDKFSSHFNLHFHDCFFLFNDEILNDENNMFVSSILNTDDLHRIYLKRLLSFYYLAYNSSSSYLPSIELKVKNSTIHEKNDKFIKMDILIDCWFKPHNINGKCYNFHTKQCILDFFEYEMDLPKSILNKMDIDILKTFK